MSNYCSKETQPADKYECIPTTDKVADDEYLSGMSTDSLFSDQMIHKEHCPEQYTGYQTGLHSPVRPSSEILKCALQELGTVYHKLQEADLHNLCSTDIIQAAMSELDTVSWLLHRAMQQSSPSSQPDLSPHLQWPEEEMLHYVTREHQDYRFLQSPRGEGDNRASHISAHQF